MLKRYLPVIVVVALLAVVLVVRFAAGGGEDNWICDGGLWVPHGHPSAPMPAEGCGGPVPTKIEFSSSTPQATSAEPGRPLDCPQYVNCMPGPDVSRTCVIPPGCEGSTEKVY
ncbi:hypothetical protein M1432_03295 [Patescibacteria group bacterium]|nr:hypothetical protein [Patescibacteria group bacterium]